MDDKKKIFVVIASYGTKNDVYLQRLLKEYRSMTHEVHVVVLSNIPKHLGADIEVVMHKPKGHPWSFPFVHRKMMADRLNDYDLFIYSEDDTLIAQRNIDAFLRVSDVLPQNEIAGFIRSERSAAGQRFFSTVHGHFHWDPCSVVSRADYTFASISNDHSASYLITQFQLRTALQSGGFLVGPHEGKYDLLVSAATDPYTQCGFKKVICISHIDDFVLPHLPNKYLGLLGLPEEDFFRQLDALKTIDKKAHPCTVLLNAETKLWHFEASKYYYEICKTEIIDLIPTQTRHALSYGCGWGVTEEELVRKGIHVTAIPLDSVVGVCAAARGIEVVYGDSETALAQLSGQHFDCILLSDVLHLVRDPQPLLAKLSSLLSPCGIIVASVPNLSQLPILWRRLSGQPGIFHLHSFERTGSHTPSARTLRRWFSRSELKVRELVPTIPRRARWANLLSGSLLSNFLAREFVLVAAKA